jgi:hypothetical protein
VLGPLGLFSGVSAPAAVETGGVMPHLVRCTEAAVWMASLLSLDNMSVLMMLMNMVDVWWVF